MSWVIIQEFTGNPEQELQEYGRSTMEYTDACRYVPFVFLLHFLGSLFGVPS